ncbi:uncharacterized protein LOC127834351 isoform X2 [Dreissena polymorpha]|uniref:uncharacterized protein LOC127834351 isoform X2 n=1 Tax=Dreissena polymorpha TaxID=45954 RepID=UPI002263EF59|nr:uncharacterized protein LOC127834351 isoform X2 [Dreissena polymorpha]
MSQEDKQFVKIMDNSMKKMSNGHLSAPLLFKEQRPRLPSNFGQAKHRTETLVKQLKNNHAKSEQFVEFMGKMFKNNHAELAPSDAQGDEVWYLPVFGVFHPKKPNKIRVVFDSAAKYQGTSLNDVLLTGPDLTNNLAGVLTNFRREKYAAMADVEQMFFNFEVHEEHRDFLRFIWFHENDISKPLVEYRMRVHVFGNSPSPAVATYGMRKSVCSHDMKGEECDEVCRYVRQNFYVDDGLVSKTDENELVDLIKETRNRLQAGGSICLHKIVSNSPRVLSSFPQTDLAKDITEIDFNGETPFIQKSLGMSWDVV